MNTKKKVQINLSIPEQHRNMLRRMAAERMISDPDQVVTGASIATELLLAGLAEIKLFNQQGGKKNDSM